MLSIILWIILGIYAGGWVVAAVFLSLIDPKNKWEYLVVALAWPVYVSEVIKFRVWK